MPAFLGGDGLERVSKKCFMIVGDRSDNTELRSDNIGRIQPAAQTHFNDADIAALLKGDNAMAVTVSK